LGYTRGGDSQISEPSTVGNPSKVFFGIANGNPSVFFDDAEIEKNRCSVCFFARYLQQSLCQGTTLPNTVSMVLVTTGPPKVCRDPAGMRTHPSERAKQKTFSPLALKKNYSTYNTRRTPEVL